MTGLLSALAARVNPPAAQFDSDAQAAFDAALGRPTLARLLLPGAPDDGGANDDGVNRETAVEKERVSETNLPTKARRRSRGARNRFLKINVFL